MQSILDLNTSIFALMALAAFIGGFIDSIAGGGGLLVLPALLLTGMDPLYALGTNKLQSSFGSFSATLTYALKGHVNLRKYAPLALLSAFFSLVGAWLLTWFSTAWLLTLMPVLLISIAIYFTFSGSIKNAEAKARISLLTFSFLVLPFIAGYDGFFGPGAGSLYVLSIITLLGLPIIPASGLTKYLNFGSNVGALILFVFTGQIFWVLGLVMGLCQFVGAQFGARLAIKIGAELIRPLLIIVSIAMALKLLLNSSHPFSQFLKQLF